MIGMPGSGKSTIGVILAKAIGYGFIDGDLMIQEREKKLLSEIIAEKGTEEFLKIENEVNSSIAASRCVIAPGGSVIYGKEAMEHLREIGTVIYLKLSYKSVAFRLGDLRRRGVALKEGQSLQELYEERCPLYEKYAHIIVEADDLSVGEVMEKIKASLKENNQSV